MSLFENIILNQVRRNLNKALDLSNVVEIAADNLKEHRDIPYQNRSVKELLMDIFEPDVTKGTELPVIVNIHGGGLIDGNKDLSVVFCRQLAKRV